MGDWVLCPHVGDACTDTRPRRPTAYDSPYHEHPVDAPSPKGREEREEIAIRQELEFHKADILSDFVARRRGSDRAEDVDRRARRILARLRTPETEAMEMALCEQERVVLRPDTLYVFRVHDGCERCAILAAPYSTQDPNAGGSE